MKTITYKQLRELGAQCDQLKLFKELFGDEVNVTIKRAKKVADKFDWDWLANRTLSAPAEAVYQKAVAPAEARAYIKQK